MIAQGANIGPDKFLVLDKAALEFAQAHAAELVGMQATDEGIVPNPNPAMAITESTRDMLRGLVVRAFKEGLSPAQLAKAIEASVGFSEHRAYDMAIAETAGWRRHCLSCLRHTPSHSNCSCPVFKVAGPSPELNCHQDGSISNLTRASHRAARPTPASLGYCACSGRRPASFAGLRLFPCSHQKSRRPRKARGLRYLLFAPDVYVVPAPIPGSIVCIVVRRGR